MARVRLVVATAYIATMLALVIVSLLLSRSEGNALGASSVAVAMLGLLALALGVAIVNPFGANRGGSNSTADRVIAGMHVAIDDLAGLASSHDHDAIVIGCRRATTTLLGNLEDARICVAHLIDGAMRLPSLSGQCDGMRQVRLIDLPPRVVAALISGDAVEAHGQTERTCLEAFGVDPESHLTLAPIVANGEPIVIIVVCSRQPLEGEHWNGLRGIARIAVSAVERIGLAKQRHRPDQTNGPPLLQPSEAVTLVDSSGAIWHQSAALERYLGYGPSEMVGNWPLTCIHADDRTTAEAMLDLRRNQSEMRAPNGLRWRHKAGHWERLITNASSIWQDDQFRAIAVTTTLAKPITRQHGAIASSDRDSLTDLIRREQFRDALGMALACAVPKGSQIAVLHLDIDRFKVVNDSLGHTAGDAVLIRFAERLIANVGERDLVARIDGDEFAILVHDVTDLWSAIRLTDRLTEALQLTTTVGGHEIVVTASIGVALGSPGLDDADVLFQQAAMAVSEAKRSGKARYAIYHESMKPTSANRLDLESGLRRALTEDELVVYYQPLIDMNSGHIAEVEALVRWRHPERGLLMPGEFIPLAEETGLIVPLGHWVLREACRQVRAWNHGHPSQPPLQLGVNLSARQFQQPGLVAHVARALGASRLDPRRLKLEITESVAMLEEESTFFTLNELRLLGVRLAMDDFGTGYSALRSLKRFPLDHLKIDRSFISGLGTDAGDTAIVRAVVEFAKQLGLRVTAEGIETEEQMAALRDLGCDLGQGYLISAPRPWPDIAELLDAQASAIASANQSTVSDRQDRHQAAS